MIRFKTDIDQMIKKQVANISVHTVHSVNDFKNILLLINSEANNSDKLPLELKKEISERLSNEKIDNIADEFFKFYKSEASELHGLKIFERYKLKLISSALFLLIVIVSYVFHLFSDKGLTIIGHLTHLLSLFLCGFFAYRIIEKYHEYSKKFSMDQDNLFRNKIFVKIDGKINDIYKAKVTDYGN